MTDNLRDLIAAAVCNWHHGEPTAWVETSEPSREEWRGCADAVVADLGPLDIEHGCPTAGQHGCRCAHRYVTKWTAND